MSMNLHNKYIQKKYMLDLLFKYNYIPKENEQNLVTYKYTGIDKSYLYNYVLSPLANKSVQYIPMWIAPNVLTLLGFICCVVPHLLFFCYGFSLEMVLPNWLIWMNAIFYFLYINFDNMDGKQARRTIIGNSTPLGMIFDHNLDSTIVVLQSINSLALLKFGDSPLAYFIYSLPAIPFHIVAIEEYFTHKMTLPVINAASEGTFSVLIAYLITAFYGQDWWLTTNYFGVEYRMQTLYGFVVFSFLGTPFMQGNIYLDNPKNLVPALKHSLFIFFFFGSIFYSVWFSPNGLCYSHMRYYLYLVGFTMSKSVGIVSVYAVSRTKLSYYRKSNTIVVLILLGNVLSYQLTGQTIVDEEVLLFVLLAVTLLIHAHFFYNMTRQISEVLNIPVFKVKVKN